MAVKVGSFIADVPGGGTIQSVNVGFEPDVVLFFTGTLTSDTSVSGALQYAMTFATDPTRLDVLFRGYGFQIYSLTGSPNSTSYNSVGSFYVFDNDGVIQFQDNSSLAVLGYGAINAFTATGFEIAWDPHLDGYNNIDAYKVYYLAISDTGGTFVDEVRIDSGSKSITGIGFQPNLILNWTIESSGSIHGANVVSSIGAADYNFNAGAIGTKTGTNLDTGAYSNQTEHGSGYLVHFLGDMPVSYPQFPAVNSSLSSMDADGFTINSTYDAPVPPGFPEYLGYLALSYNYVKVGSFTLNTSPGSQSVTGVGFLPEAVLFYYSGTGESALDSSKSQFGMGMYDTNLNTMAFCATHTNAGNKDYIFSGTTCIETGPASTEYSVAPVSLDADGFSLNILTASISPAPTVWYVALGVTPFVSSSDFFRRIEGMEMPPKETHYMSIPHATAGIAKSAWTINLYKQGERVTDVPVDVVENPDGHYTFSFVNDGQHEKIWNLTAYPTATPTSRYAQSWIVKKRITESTVKYLRSKADSESGFFKSNVNKE